MNYRCCLLFIALAACGWTGVAVRAAVVCDFESASDLARWGFSVGTDSVGGTGSVSTGLSGGNTYGQLNYDFTPIPDSTAPFEPHYVQAKLNLAADPSANAVALNIAVNAAQARVRLVDATGQTFQNSLNPGGALETTDPTALNRAVIKFGYNASSWGGAADGVFHAPAKSLTILAEATGRRGTGWVRFDQVELLSLSSAAVVLDDIRHNLLVPVNRHGTLAERLGVSVHFYSDNRALDIIQSAGFKWIRMDLKWEQAEKIAGTYDFSFYRPLVAAAEARGLRTLSILAYGNPLYTADRMAPPTTPEAVRAFAEYAAAAVAALHDTNPAFEVWNESDLGTYWGGSPDAAQYGALLDATVARIRRDGSASVLLTAGLTAPGTATRSYLKTLEATGALAAASGLGMHFYTQSSPETRWDDLLELSGNASRILSGGKVWCTEWGYSSTSLDSAANGYSSASRKKQAVYLARMLLVGWLADLPLLNVYDFQDDGVDPANKEYNFGLVDRDYVEKPALQAIRTLTGHAATRELIGAVDPALIPAGMHAAKLAGAGDEVWIIWLDDRTVAPSVSLVLPAGYQRVTDLLGADLAAVVTAAGPTVELRPENGPVYVRLAANPPMPPSAAKIKISD